MKEEDKNKLRQLVHCVGLEYIYGRLTGEPINEIEKQAIENFVKFTETLLSEKDKEIEKYTNMWKERKWKEYDHIYWKDKPKLQTDVYCEVENIADLYNILNTAKHNDIKLNVISEGSQYVLGTVIEGSKVLVKFSNIEHLHYVLHKMTAPVLQKISAPEFIENLERPKE
jgi:transcriptional regulator of heat shock response